MKTVYLFNPENDMALASGSPYYMPPASAKKMASDLASLPSWYADEGGAVLLSEWRQVEWMRKDCDLSLPIEWVLDYEGDRISAWGWNSALIRRLGESGMLEKIPQFCSQMDVVRNLSSRKTAVVLLPKLCMEGTIGESFWLTSVDEVVGCSSKYDKVLLKAPWSGSGKGIQPLVGMPDDNLRGWTKRVIATQGGVVCEPYYNKVEDFAMEFLVSANGLKFAGYSLFESDARGIYKENWLASDEAIEKRLSKYVPIELITRVREKLLQELPLFIGDGYQGYFGVDMMIVRTAMGYAIHPCVEVNLRMNMGVVSRLFFDRYVCPDACGRYVIEYYPHEGDALHFHEEMKREHPLQLREGRIEQGYVSLTPIFEDTAYQIYALIK